MVYISACPIPHRKQVYKDMIDGNYEIVIEPRKKLKHYWKELWLYRELFFFLSWKELLVQYKQSIIGIAWAVIQPVMTMIVFTLIFGRVAKLPSDGVPYPILVYSATLPWQFFASSLQNSSNSVVQNANLITKIYFPRLIIPSSSIITSLVNFAISFIVLIILMVVYKYYPTWNMFALPLFLFVLIFFTLGSSFLIGSLNVKYRDFRIVIPFIIRLGLYISPVGFSSNLIPDKWRFLYSLNPLVGVVDGFRWCILGKDSMIYLPGLACSVGMAILAFIAGLWYFRKTERTFADVI